MWLGEDGGPDHSSSEKSVELKCGSKEKKMAVYSILLAQNWSGRRRNGVLDGEVKLKGQRQSMTGKKKGEILVL